MHKHTENTPDAMATPSRRLNMTGNACTGACHPVKHPSMAWRESSALPDMNNKIAVHSSTRTSDSDLHDLGCNVSVMQLHRHCTRTQDEARVDELYPLATQGGSAVRAQQQQQQEQRRQQQHVYLFKENNACGTSVDDVQEILVDDANECRCDGINDDGSVLSLPLTVQTQLVEQCVRQLAGESYNFGDADELRHAASLCEHGQRDSCAVRMSTALHELHYLFRDTNILRSCGDVCRFTTSRSKTCDTGAKDGYKQKGGNENDGPSMTSEWCNRYLSAIRQLIACVSTDARGMTKEFASELHALGVISSTVHAPSHEYKVTPTHICLLRACRGQRVAPGKPCRETEHARHDESTSVQPMGVILSHEFSHTHSEITPLSVHQSHSHGNTPMSKGTHISASCAPLATAVITSPEMQRYVHTPSTSSSTPVPATTSRVPRSVTEEFNADVTEAAVHLTTPNHEWVDRDVTRPQCTFTALETTRARMHGQQHERELPHHNDTTSEPSLSEDNSLECRALTTQASHDTYMLCDANQANDQANGTRLAASPVSKHTRDGQSLYETNAQKEDAKAGSPTTPASQACVAYAEKHGHAGTTQASPLNRQADPWYGSTLSPHGAIVLTYAHTMPDRAHRDSSMGRTNGSTLTPTLCRRRHTIVNDHITTLDCADADAECDGSYTASDRNINAKENSTNENNTDSNYDDDVYNDNAKDNNRSGTNTATQPTSVGVPSPKRHSRIGTCHPMVTVRRVSSRPVGALASGCQRLLNHARTGDDTPTRVRCDAMIYTASASAPPVAVPEVTVATTTLVNRLQLTDDTNKKYTTEAPCGTRSYNTPPEYIAVSYSIHPKGHARSVNQRRSKSSQSNYINHVDVTPTHARCTAIDRAVAVRSVGVTSSNRPDSLGALYRAHGQSVNRELLNVPHLPREAEAANRTYAGYIHPYSIPIDYEEADDRHGNSNCNEDSNDDATGCADGDGKTSHRAGLVTPLLHRAAGEASLLRLLTPRAPVRRTIRRSTPRSRSASVSHTANHRSTSPSAWLQRASGAETICTELRMGTSTLTPCRISTEEQKVRQQQRRSHSQAQHHAVIDEEQRHHDSANDCSSNDNDHHDVQPNHQQQLQATPSMPYNVSSLCMSHRKDHECIRDTTCSNNPLHRDGARAEPKMSCAMSSLLRTGQRSGDDVGARRAGVVRGSTCERAGSMRRDLPCTRRTRVHLPDYSLERCATPDGRARAEGGHDRDTTPCATHAHASSNSRYEACDAVCADNDDDGVQARESAPSRRRCWSSNNSRTKRSPVRVLALRALLPAGGGSAGSKENTQPRLVCNENDMCRQAPSCHRPSHDAGFESRNYASHMGAKTESDTRGAVRSIRLSNTIHTPAR